MSDINEKEMRLQKNICVDLKSKGRNIGRSCMIVSCNGFLEKGRSHCLNGACLEICLGDGRVVRDANGNLPKRIFACGLHFESPPEGVSLSKNLEKYLKKQFDGNGYNVLQSRTSTLNVIVKRKRSLDEATAVELLWVKSEKDKEKEALMQLLEQKTKDEEKAAGFLMTRKNHLNSMPHHEFMESVASTIGPRSGLTGTFDVLAMDESTCQNFVFSTLNLVFARPVDLPPNNSLNSVRYYTSDSLPPGSGKKLLRFNPRKTIWTVLADTWKRPQGRC
jgi:hypothetical protein